MGTFREFLSSIVVFLVALPLCMGIAIASGVPPAMGLVSGIVGGLIVGLFAGSPLQVSGPAAGLAVIVFEFVQEHDVALLAPVIVLAGLMQIAAARLRLGQWFRAVVPAVIYGMLAGIGVLIFASQFHVMVDDDPAGSGITNLITIPGAVMKGVTPSDDTFHHYAAMVGITTLVVLVVWNWVREHGPSMLKHVPAPLLAVIAGTGLSVWLGQPIKKIEVPSGVDTLFTLPNPSDFMLLLEPAMFGTAITLAVIASAESLLCATAVDKLHDGEATNYDRELFAQGIGNTVAGFVGGLPITGVIVRSTANVDAGAKTRWSAVMHGAWLLIMVLAFPWILAYIPTSALAAILVYIGYKLVNPQTIKKLAARGKAELGVYVLTVVAIVATNLLEGLMIGLVVALMRVAYTASNMDIETEKRDDGVFDVRLRGAATFVKLPFLARTLEDLPDDAEVHIHLEHLQYIDHACIELISEWEKRREDRGGTLVMEWQELEDRQRDPYAKDGGPGKAAA